MTAPEVSPLMREFTDALDCCGTCAGGVLTRHVAAARADERERVLLGVAEAVKAYRIDRIGLGPMLRRLAALSQPADNEPGDA